MDRPPLIDVEVLPPLQAGPESRAPDAGAGEPPGPHPAPIREAFHPAAAALLVLVDNLWMLPEFAVVTWWLTIPLSFLTVFAVTLFIQRGLGRNPWMVAIAKALFFGVVAAVPLSVTGTPIGLALLAWAGVKRLAR